MTKNLCKNNKSSENYEVNEAFLSISAQINAEKALQSYEQAINFLISQLGINSLCSKRLKVLDLSSDYINGVVDFRQAPVMVHISERLKEAAISSIAEEISVREGVKVVLIAGPSSSGKTTFCKKLSYALQQQGLTPRSISLDDYFVDRENTPRDENGDYDYESLYALKLDQLHEDLARLMAGDAVTLPRYDFPTGKNIAGGGPVIKLDEGDVLMMEGIHALNPEITRGLIGEEEGAANPFFKVYISGLALDRDSDGTVFPTTDNRLVRRMVRDSKFRNATAQNTISRWASVRRGEEKWVVPFQKYADYNFNSCYPYELCLLKEHALPLLYNVKEGEPEYEEAQRLIAVMERFHDIPVDVLPPYSLLREFLGGSRYEY